VVEAIADQLLAGHAALGRAELSASVM
jgi:hypothetical protein